MNEVATPPAQPAEASTVETKPAETTEVPQATEPAEKPPEKTEREIFLEKQLKREQRRIGNLTKRLYQQPEPPAQTEQADDDTVSLSKAELQALIEKEARQLAPTIKQQQSDIEHRQKLVGTLAKEWGQEKFDSLSRDLEDAFDGLTDKPLDKGGKPKPAVDAIFESDDAKALIEYLADPEHADEAEALARMTATQAGRAVAKLELKLAKPKDKPQASNAPAPIEPVRPSGTTSPKRLADAKTQADFNRMRAEQIRRRGQFG